MKLMILGCVIAITLFETSGDLTRAHSEFEFKPIAHAESMSLVQTQDEQIVKILTNKALWRDDFPSLLRVMKSLNVSGETKISVLSNEAYGERKFVFLEALVKEVGTVHSLINDSAALKPDVLAKLNEVWNQPLDAVTVAGQPGGDDGTLRVSLTSTKVRTSNMIPKPEFLATGLTLSTIKQQTGEPEKVTTQIIDSGEDERRPVILTLYHYAGDAIIFAVSDMSPNPEIIDRAILDTQKVSRAISRNSGN
jgi:hypothetical protein